MGAGMLRLVAHRQVGRDLVAKDWRIYTEE